MKIENLNTETKLSEETGLFTDEVNMLDRVGTETERLREELAYERVQRLRLAAEFDNYRRRTRHEQTEAAERGKRELLERLIPIADDFELALAKADGSPGAVAEGLRMIERRFRKALAANGVVRFESEGEEFDPERHEAFDVVGGTENRPETVHRQIRRGYFWNGKLLRPALVIVAQ
jgi:molecular chaperone GrpE